VKLFGLWLLPIPVGAVVVGFWGCGFTVDTSGAGGGSMTAVASAASTTSGYPGAGGGGGAPGAGGIAAPCMSMSDCGPGLDCLLPSASDPVFGGGVAGGFCTEQCNDDTDCVAGGGVCYSTVENQSGLCTLPCTLGPPLVSVFDPLVPTKCLGREDVRCDKTTMEGDVCLPTCGSDTECGGGFCDPRTGVCVGDAGVGFPTGTPCPLADAGAPDPCAGTCIFFTTQGTNGMCSRPCVLGAAGKSDGGNINDTCGGPENGLCAFHPEAYGAGDVGYCTLACTTPSDCLNPSFACFSVPALTAAFSKGYCFPATACPNGQQDCGAGSTYVCATTPSGPQCLDPAFLPALPDGGTLDAGDAGSSYPEADGGPSYADAGLGDLDAGVPDASLLDAGDAGPIVDAAL
jgi:hypothetical protein